MTSTDKEKANQSEVSVVNETPILDPNTEVEIINLANPFDVRGKCYLYHEEEGELKHMLLRKDDKKKTSLIKELAEVKNAGQLSKTRLSKEYPFLASQKQIILLPYSPISRSHISSDTYPENKINRTKIINTFWKSELNLSYDAAEGLILVCSFLAKNVDRHTLGLGISKTKIAVSLGMSVRRVSDILERLKELGYVNFYKEKVKRGNLSLGTFVQLTHTFSTQFLKSIDTPTKNQTDTSHKPPENTSHERHFEFMERLNNLRLNLKKFIIDSKEPIPPVVLEQVFKVLG
ncbi:hypothetical protein [Vibrio atlanticus]|uniref:Uncharacterized protein n=1 Tax=Vibrio atlanticus TaxID=693153 RepID=A0A1C3IYY2_9VIBR|nr:hypothetical protein [Vibrio atlanticus]SBS66620.1 hypothetical protein VAT7223_03270 [Vibrio atlanticus]